MEPNEFLGWAADDFGDKVIVKRVGDTDYTQIQFWMEAHDIDFAELMETSEVAKPDAYMTFMPEELAELAKLLAEAAQKQASAFEDRALQESVADLTKGLDFNSSANPAHYFYYGNDVIARVGDDDIARRLLAMLQTHVDRLDKQ